MICFSLGSQPLSVSLLAKHFSSTPTAIKAAVEAPGEASGFFVNSSEGRRGEPDQRGWRNAAPPNFNTEVVEHLTVGRCEHSVGFVNEHNAYSLGELI